MKRWSVAEVEYQKAKEKSKRVQNKHAGTMVMGRLEDAHGHAPATQGRFKPCKRGRRKKKGKKARTKGDEIGEGLFPGR